MPSEVVTKPWLAPRNPVSANTLAVICFISYVFSDRLLPWCPLRLCGRGRPLCLPGWATTEGCPYIVCPNDFSIPRKMRLVDDCDFFDRKLRGDLRSLFGHYHHLF